MNLRSTSIAVLALATSPAFAQPPPVAPVDPVVVYFREYRAALDRGDTAAAERAAQRAYEASEAANGAKTGVLALNLATLRLDLGKPAEAHAPARRADDLATNPASGVDPLLAALQLGRAELAVDAASGAARLLPAILQAERSNEWPTESYSGAVELARSAFEAHDYELARGAWAASARLASGSSDEPAFARGLARSGEGAAIFMEALKAGEHTPERGGPPVTVVALSAARDANTALAAALSLLAPFANDENVPDLTVAQSVYAQALAWQSVLRAKMRSQGEELPRSPDAPAVGAAAEQSRCTARLIAEPAPVYPKGALMAAGVGAVVMRVSTDAKGAIVKRQIVAAIPIGEFSDAVSAVADQWRVEIAADAAPGCRLDGTRYTPILFVAE